MQRVGKVSRRDITRVVRARSAAPVPQPLADTSRVQPRKDDADERVAHAGRLLMIAERRNAAATIAAVAPPFTPAQIRRLAHDVIDAEEECCGTIPSTR